MKKNTIVDLTSPALSPACVNSVTELLEESSSFNLFDSVFDNCEEDKVSFCPSISKRRGEDS